MKPPRRRKQRTWHWKGYVVDIHEQAMWVLMVPMSFNGKQITAEFDRKLCPELQTGDRFTLYSYMRGKKTRLVMRPITFTDEQVEAATKSAQARALEIGAWVSSEADATVLSDHHLANVAGSPSPHHTLPSNLSSSGR